MIMIKQFTRIQCIDVSQCKGETRGCLSYSLVQYFAFLFPNSLNIPISMQTFTQTDLLQIKYATERVLVCLL